MFDVGDAVPLVATPLDSDRNPVDVADIALAVTLPDGTATGPLTPSHDGTGAYSYSYTTTQAGRHVARWAGISYATTEVFNVWPADPRMLFSLDDARAAIGHVPQDKNEQLRLYIAASTEVLEDICGPLLTGASKTVTESGGVSAILIPPGSVVTAVTENGAALVAGSSYVLDQRAGIIYAGTAQSSRTFCRGSQNISISYTAGGVLPPNVLLAAIEEFRFLWQIGQQGARPAFGQVPESEAYTPSGFAVPRRVLELCAGYRRPPTVA